MRDRLIALIRDCCEFSHCQGKQDLEICKNQCDKTTTLADHLLSNGVIVPPCKVGDTVYYIEGAYYKSKRQTVAPIKVSEISWKCDRSGRDLGFALIANGTRYKFSSIGKTVFLTKEEAEKALAERSGE